MNISDFWSIVSKFKNDKSYKTNLTKKFKPQDFVLFDLYLSKLICNKSLKEFEDYLFHEVIAMTLEEVKDIELAQKEIEDKELLYVYETFVLNEILEGEDNYKEFVRKIANKEINYKEYLDKHLKNYEDETPFIAMFRMYYLGMTTKINGLFSISEAVLGFRNYHKLLIEAGNEENNESRAITKKYKKNNIIDGDRLYLDKTKEIRNKYETIINNEINLIYKFEIEPQELKTLNEEDFWDLVSIYSKSKPDYYRELINYNTSSIRLFGSMLKNYFKLKTFRPVYNLEFVDFLMKEHKEEIQKGDGDFELIIDTHFSNFKEKYIILQMTKGKEVFEKEFIKDPYKDFTKENIKKAFVPKQLKHVKYDGPDYREGKNIKGEDYLREFNFKGGEFGNWLNNNDRQASLNYGYEAFHSLANALNIDNKDISLNNNLSIAFGSRGTGKALAHYEPLREVINLTKMNGAGSLAHEWGHAIDDILNKSITGKALGQRNSRDLTQIQKNLTDIMKYKTVVVPNEEQIKKKEESINTAKKHIETYLINVLPRDEKLTEEQIKRKNELVEKVINDESIEWGNYISFNLGRIRKSDNVLTVESIDNLAAFVKETKHTRLNKDTCKSINNFVAKLNDAKKIKIDEKQTVKVKTDFYKNSNLFDTLFSKESKGYWSSDVEMFARAFSCYVDDKLKEQDIVCDYLTGHSNLAIAPYNDELIRAYPVGEERKLINKEFDKLINHFKELGLLNEREIIKERTINREEKTINKEKAFNIVEKKGGQLTFF